MAACTLHNVCIYPQDKEEEFLDPHGDDGGPNEFVNIFATDNNPV